MKGLRRKLWPVVFIAAFVLAVRPSVGSDASFTIQSIQPTTNEGFALTWLTVRAGRTK